jgi:hypothetical protein
VVAKKKRSAAAELFSVEVLSHYLAFEVLPWPGANVVARIDGGLALRSLRTQISSPGFSARAVALRQLLTVPVGAFEAAENTPLARSSTGHKERHAGRLRQLRCSRLLCFGAFRHTEH